MQRPSTKVSGVEFDLRAGRALAPTTLFVGYGIVKFFTLGVALTHWLDTYLPVVGGVASWLAVIVYSFVFALPRPSVRRFLCAFAAYIPMLYSIYAIAYLGLYAIYNSTIVSFSILRIAFGVICIALGYSMAHGLAALTALGVDPPAG